MVQNALRTPSWNFEVPNIQNALAPIQQGLRDYRQIEQQGVENDRADRGMAIQEGQFGLQKQRYDDERAQKVKEAAGNLALLTIQEQDPARRAEKWRQFVTSRPDIEPEYHDPATGPQLLLARAGMVPQYMDYQSKMAADRRAAAAEERAAAMHTPQLEAARLQADVARRQFDEPRATADLNAGHNRIIYDPRTGANVATISGPPKPPDATDRKAGWEAEDELPNLKSALDQLDEAKSLLPKIYTGYGAGIRSTFNQAAPGMLPNIITDPGRAQATQRYNQILGAESISAMSNTLKGATTDFEMREFSRLMNDPNQTAETKLLALNNMIAKARNHYEIKSGRLRELGRRVPELSGGSGTGRPTADPLGIR